MPKLSAFPALFEGGAQSPRVLLPVTSSSRSLRFWPPAPAANISRLKTTAEAIIQHAERALSSSSSTCSRASRSDTRSRGATTMAKQKSTIAPREVVQLTASTRMPVHRGHHRGLDVAQVLAKTHSHLAHGSSRLVGANDVGVVTEVDGARAQDLVESCRNTKRGTPSPRVRQPSVLGMKGVGDRHAPIATEGLL